VTRLPIVDFKTMEKVLVRLGFQAVRQRGSHVFFRHSDGRTTTVPNHPGRDLARPLVREILREVELTPQEFGKHLRKLSMLLRGSLDPAHARWRLCSCAGSSKPNRLHSGGRAPPPEALAPCRAVPQGSNSPLAPAMVACIAFCVC